MGRIAGRRNVKEIAAQRAQDSAALFQVDTEHRVANLERRKIMGKYEIKLFADDEGVVLKDPAFQFMVPEDLDGAQLRVFLPYVTTPCSSGEVSLYIYNVTQAWYISSSDSVIEQGEYSTLTSNDPGGIDIPPYSIVNYQDMIKIVVNNAGPGAKGLAVIARWL